MYTMYIPTNTCQVAYTVVYIQNNINIYFIELELKKKKTLLHPLFCFGLVTAPHPLHEQCSPLLQNRRAHLLTFYAEAFTANCKIVWQVLSQCA